MAPTSPLVDAWADRNLEHEGALAQLASSCGWDSYAPGALAVARSAQGQDPAERSRDGAQGPRAGPGPSALRRLGAPGCPAA